MRKSEGKTGVISDDVQDLLRFNEAESQPVEGDVLSSVTEEESSDTGEMSEVSRGKDWSDLSRLVNSKSEVQMLLTSAHIEFRFFSCRVKATLYHNDKAKGNAPYYRVL